MPILLYNTMSRKLEEFAPSADGAPVKLYTCGPTVYNFAHIGNFRAYVAQDILKRYLLYRGMGVKHVMNLTDVDDKTIRDSRKEGTELSVFTARYKKAFFEDCGALNLAPADVYPEATKYIEEMITMIEALLAKGLAYNGEDGSIYFSVKSFPGYGKLSKIPMDSLQSGERMKKDEYTKEQANDFALWKAWDEADGMVYWESPFGRGRPGWHIECSAMSIKNLGETLDIHAGGVDLIFPHHEDEIAQSEGYTGKEFSRFWVHNEYLMVDGKKMSKSLGNFYTLRDVLAKGYSGKAVRYLLLASHYRQPLNFTFSALDGAASAVTKLEEFVRNCKDAAKGTANKEDALDLDTGESLAKVHCLIAERNFERALDADLSTPEALATVFEFVRTMNNFLGRFTPAQAERVLETMHRFDSVLGVMGEVLGVAEEIPLKVSELVEAREAARSAKDWAEADRLRKDVEAMGYSIQDQKGGKPKVRKA